jgi:hypothetical protein
MFSRLFLATTLTICLSASLHAQIVNPNQRRMQQHQQQQMQQPKQTTEIQGTIEGMMQGRLVVQTADQRWQVAVPNNAKMQVTGTASAECLQSGTFVEFKAEIDDRGAIKEKVGELTVVSLSPERQAGLFPEGGEKAQPGFGEEVATDHGKAGKSAKRPKATAGKTGKSGGKNAIPAGSYRVVGKLAVGRGGKYTVQAGHSPLSFELTEQATVAIDTSDYTLASKGDKITVKGVVPNPRMPLTHATEVKIELSEPLAGPKKKGSTAKAEAKRPAKKAKADEGLPEPPAEK